MSGTRDFPTAVIASLSTGTVLCKFSEMQEAAEYLMGHPIWSHHFASKDMEHKLQRAVLEQCPTMPTSISDVNESNYQAKVAEIEAAIGKVVTIRQGDGATAMHPMDGLPRATTTIVV